MALPKLEIISSKIMDDGIFFKNDCLARSEIFTFPPDMQEGRYDDNPTLTRKEHLFNPGYSLVCSEMPDG